MDVTIRVGDRRVRAQRNILSVFSRYFEKLFSVNMSDEIELRDVSGEVVEMLVHYAHTGSLDISEANVKDLLRAASFLRIDSVADDCCEYLKNNLTVENCLDVHGLSVTSDQLNLRKSVERFIIEHFKELTIEDHFTKMPVGLLIQLLESDEVTVVGGEFCADPVEQEQKILEIVLRFVGADPDGRRLHLPLLLSRGVRLMLLPPFSLKALKSSQLILTSPESLKLISRASSLEASEEEEKRWKHPRTVLYHQKTPELASTVSLQSQIPPEVFDDSKLVTEGQCIYVTGMKVYTRRWGDGRPIVGGLEVSYNTGHNMLHGSDGYGYEDHEFRLDPGERITAISASTGYLIDRLTFASNLGKTYGPYGGFGGTHHYLERPYKGAYLAYVTGSVETIQDETAIRHIRFVWGFYARSVPVGDTGSPFSQSNLSAR